MAWPTAPVVTTGMDADTDSLPRSDILDLTTKFNDLIAMRGVAGGVCDLDGAGVIPTARIPAAIARLASPDLSGTPTAPTAALRTNSTQLSTTAFVLANGLLNGKLSKPAAYTVGAADYGKLIDCTGSGGWTLAIDAVAILGVFAFAYRNSTSGTITIDPNGSETIDGVATLAIAPGESGIVLCDGVELTTVGRTFITYRTANTGMPPAGSANSAAHPLARIPDNARIELLCVISERGFGVGTVVEATGEWPGTGAASSIEVWKTSTAVGFNFSSGETFFLRDVSTGVAFTPTGANWVYRFVLD